VLDRALTKDPDERYQTADELAHALRAAKDPTWQGQIKDATIRLEARTQAKALPLPVDQPTMAVGQPSMAVPRAVAAPKAPRSRLVLILALVGVVGLGAVAGGGFLFYKWASLRKLAVAAGEAPLQEGSSETVPTPVSPEEPSQALPPAAAKLPASAPEVEPEPLPQAQTAAQSQPKLVAQPQHPPKLPPPVITEAPPVTVSKPIPESPAVEGLSSQAQKNASNVTLSEAIRLADSDPNRAIEGLRRVVAADPANTNAYAWLAVVLYEQGRFQEIPPVIAKARQHGIPRARLMSNMRFKMIMQNDKLNHRIPGGTGGDE